MKVSVIIPVFNGESCLEKAVNSVLKQSFKKEDYEIIVINESKRDNTSF
jgi:glycosyltransferase involved in cell wall biosynthesis